MGDFFQYGVFLESFVPSKNFLTNGTRTDRHHRVRREEGDNEGNHTHTSDSNFAFLHFSKKSFTHILCTLCYFF